jgi:death-on-curing protein
VKDPTFLGLDEVLALDADQVARYGGSAGVRDMTLLESALATPAATFDGRFLHRSVHEMAAAYLVHLALNHPFVDGNERIALMACIVFLGLNGQRLVAGREELTALVLSVAEGNASRARVAVFLEDNTEDLGG